MLIEAPYANSQNKGEQWSAKVFVRDGVCFSARHTVCFVGLEKCTGGPGVHPAAPAPKERRRNLITAR